LTGCTLVSGNGYLMLLHRDLMELQERIREAFAAVTRDLLMRVWTEVDYRPDICHVTKGAHIESL